MPPLSIAKSPRWLERRMTTVPEHLVALDNDQDNIEGAIYVMQTNHDVLAAKMDKMNARLYGVLVSLATAALALAGNLVVHH